MNNARCFYLRICNPINVLNHLYKNVYQYYHIWKYWHKGDLDGKLIGYTTAWDMYLEYAKGNIEPDQYILVKDRIEWQEFRDKLGIEQLQYKPKNNLYPGGSNFRNHTRLQRR